MILVYTYIHIYIYILRDREMERQTDRENKKGRDKMAQLCWYFFLTCLRYQRLTLTQPFSCNGEVRLEEDCTLKLTMLPTSDDREFWHDASELYIYIYILSSTNRLFRCITTLHCGQTRRRLEAGVKTAQLYVRLSIRPLHQQAYHVSQGIIRY